MCPMGCGRFPPPGIEPGTLESGTKAMLRINLNYSVTNVLIELHPALLAQSVEHRTSKRGIPGSNPAGGRN